MAPRQLPDWAQARDIRSALGLTYRQLTGLPVRTIKLGNSRQAGRLFNVRDVVKELDLLATTGPIRSDADRGGPGGTKK